MAPGLDPKWQLSLEQEARQRAERQVDEKIVKEPHLSNQIDTLIENQYDIEKEQVKDYMLSLSAYFGQVTELIAQGFEELTLEQQEGVAEDAKKLDQLGSYLTNDAANQARYPIIQQVCQISDETLQWIYQMGYQKMQEGDFASAVILFGYVNYLNPKYVENWTSLGYSLMEMGQMEVAMESFHYAIDLDRNHLLAHLCLIDCYKQSGKLEQAKKRLEFLEPVFEEHPEKDQYHSKFQGLKRDFGL